MKFFILAISFLTFLSADQFLIIAHRGASGYEPENTIRSFKRAIDMGAKAIELDVHRCKTGELVVIHDDTVDRITNGKGVVKKMSLKEIKKLDAGKGERIPQLFEVFDILPSNVVLNIELKVSGLEQDVSKLIKKYVKSKKLSFDNFVITSFDHYRIKKIANFIPKVKTGVLFEGIPIGFSEIAIKAGAKYAMMYYEEITKEFVEDCHKNGIKVFAYTVNDKKLANELKELGVDGIFSNYPDIMSNDFSI